MVKVNETMHTLLGRKIDETQRCWAEWGVAYGGGLVMNKKSRKEFKMKSRHFFGFEQENSWNSNLTSHKSLWSSVASDEHLWIFLESLGAFELNSAGLKHQPKSTLPETKKSPFKNTFQSMIFLFPQVWIMLQRIRRRVVFPFPLKKWMDSSCELIFWKKGAGLSGQDLRFQGRFDVCFFRPGG